MGAHIPPYLAPVAGYLLAIVVIIPLFVRARLGSVLGYLAAGILLGPMVLGFVRNPQDVLGFAEFGVVLLLFVIGLELRPSKIWAMRRDIFGLGALQVVLCGLALTGGILLLTDLSWQAALVAGLPLGLSSTALVMQLLEERDIAATPFGERSFAMLLFQDLAIIPLLTIVGALSRVPDPAAPPGWELALLTAAALAGLVLAGRYLLPPMFRVLGNLGAREAFVAAALLTVTGSALVMAYLGLSMALGAFVAGVMLAESPYRHALEADIEPFRGLLVGLFFVAIGMTLDLGVVRDHWVLILALVALVMTVKTAVVAVLARGFGTGWVRAVQMGMLLSQGGEFGFVLFAAAATGLLLTPGAAQMFGAVVTITMALTPLLFIVAGRLNALITVPAAATPDGPEARVDFASDGRRVVVVGMGRFGQSISQMLNARGAQVTGIDRDTELIQIASRFDLKIYFGDGRRVDILRAAGADHADLLVFAIDGAYPPDETLGPIRAAFPDLLIVARAFDRQHWLALKRFGVETVVREVFDGAVALGRQALVLLGTPDPIIDGIEAEYRRRDQERLDLQLCTGDVYAGRNTFFRPEAPFEAPFESPGLAEIPMAEAAE